MNEFGSIMLILIIGFAVFASDRSQAFIQVIRTAGSTTSKSFSPPSNSAKGDSSPSVPSTPSAHNPLNSNLMG